MCHDEPESDNPATSPGKLSRAVVRVLGCLGAIMLVCILLILAVLWSIGVLCPRRVATDTEQTRRITADVGLQLPRSAREVDAFQMGIVDHMIWTRLVISAQDLRDFTDQKLLAGKWEDGKGFDDLPWVVAWSWRELTRSNVGGWRHWNGWVPYVKSEGELWGLDIAIGPTSKGETTVYLRLTQT